MTNPADARPRPLAVLAAAVAVLSAGWAPTGASAATTGRESDREPVPAAFAAAIAPLPGGGLRFGERLTGRIREVDASGRPAPEPVAVVEVSTSGQRGLLGLAVDARGRTFAAWTRPDRRLVVGQVDPGPARLVWRGPESTRLANGGHLAFAPDGRLVIGIGDLEARRRVADPDRPNGKLLSLDPDGPADQTPRVLSSGWNNPFAFTYTPGGELWVADNTGGTGSERLARGDRRDRPTRVTRLRGTRAPSGLAAVNDRELALCGFVSGRLDRYEIGRGGHARRTRPTLARDCRIGVVALTDGSLAYADESTIRFLTPPSSSTRG
jgi:Glucose / Sorbosone dehydrogenase